MYAQSGAQGGAQAGPDMNAGQQGGAQDNTKHGDNVQDADFEEDVYKRQILSLIFSIFILFISLYVKTNHFRCCD